MTPQERQFWQRAHRRASDLTPELAAAMLRAFAIIRETLTEVQLARIVASGDIELLIRTAFSDTVLDRAFFPVRERIWKSVEQNVKYFARDLPRGGRVDGVITVQFDRLNPKVIDAVRDLDTKVMTTLKRDVRETVRAFTENGLRDGVNPRVIGREIREVVGLSPSQERIVRNQRNALETAHLNNNALGYKLRDRRFDSLIKKARETGIPIPQARIETVNGVYRKNMIAFNAETNARTASLDAMKLGQRLSWEDAIEKGVVDRGRMMKRWVGVMDSRERPAHRAMEGQTVSFDSTFSNGQMVPGDSDFNCRCLARYFSRPSTL